jgi:hypothetical protein
MWISPFSHGFVFSIYHQPCNLWDTGRISISRKDNTASTYSQSIYSSIKVLVQRVCVSALLPQWVGKWRGCCWKWKAARCTVLSFHVVSGRRCGDDVPRVGSLLPCVGYTSVQRVMSEGSWFPVVESAAKWASWAHSGAVPPAESAAWCVTPLRDEWACECWL